MRSNGLVRAIVRLWAGMRETANLMVGLPDYQRYVAHRLARHPGLAVMTRAEFARDRMRRRYESGAAGRCC